MKIKEWFKTFFAGMAIGAGSAVPGVSGGTIAVILKVYEKIIWSVSNLFKHFKEAFRVLLPTLLGIVVALIPMVVLMNLALNGLLFAVICIFAGFIIGSIPGITDEVKEVKPNHKHIIALVVAILVAVGLGVGSRFAEANVSTYIISTPVWFYFVLIPVGFVASVALVVPGLSGGLILLLLGFYTPLIEYTDQTLLKECLHGNWSNFGHLLAILGCFAIGVILGFYLISKLMHVLLAKYHDVTFYAIIGFVIGSVAALFYNYEIYQYYKLWISGGQGYLKLYIEIPLGIILLIGAMVASYLLVRYKRKIESKKEA